MGLVTFQTVELSLGEEQVWTSSLDAIEGQGNLIYQYPQKGFLSTACTLLLENPLLIYQE